MDDLKNHTPRRQHPHSASPGGTTNRPAQPQAATARKVTYDPTQHMPKWVVKASRIRKVGKIGTTLLVIGILLLIGTLAGDTTVSPLTGQATDGTNMFEVHCGTAMSVYFGNVDTSTGVFTGLTNDAYSSACIQAAKSQVNSGVATAIVVLVIGGLGVYLGSVQQSLIKYRKMTAAVPPARPTLS